MRMLFSLFLLNFNLMVHSEPSGQTCDTVRLDKNGGPLEHVPIYDQTDFAGGTDTAICYSIAAAQAIDACRAKNKDPLNQLTSPISVALNNKSSAGDLPNQPEPTELRLTSEFLARGWPAKAIRDSRRRPLCDQKWLDQYIGALNPYSKPQTKLSKVTTLPGLENFIRAILREARLQKNSGTDQSGPRTAFFCSLASGSNGNKNDIAAAVKAASEQDMGVDRLVAFVDEICKGHTFTEACNEPKRTERTFDGESKDDLKRSRDRYVTSKLNELLSQPSPSPIVIEYLQDVLRNPKFNGIKDHANGTYDYAGQNHISIIVGREINPKTGHCGFWVRNSFGPDCNKRQPISIISPVNTSEPVRPTPKTSQLPSVVYPLRVQQTFQPYAYPCENGTILVDQDDLAKNIMAFTVIP